MSVACSCLAATEEHVISPWCQRYNRIPFNEHRVPPQLENHRLGRDKNRNTIATGVALCWKSLQFRFIVPKTYSTIDSDGDIDVRYI